MSDVQTNETKPDEEMTPGSDEETCARYESLINCVDKFIQKIRSKPGR